MGCVRMAFLSQIEQWRTVDAFNNHLLQHAPIVSSWATGVVIHHTWKPTPAQWRGKSTMNAIQQYYMNKKPVWNAAPHLFIVSGSPDASNDGIWQMTPLNERGIHAGAWNSTHWGIEVVGNYDAESWSPATRALVYGAITSLFRWRSIPYNRFAIIGHRETGSKKTCPGKCIDMNQIRGDMQQILGGG